MELSLESHSVYVVRNLVVTARLAKAFSLDEIAKLRFEGEYPQKFGKQWIGVRVGSKRRYVAVYPNGNVLVTGCDSVEEARKVLLEVEPTLRDHTDVSVSIAKLVIQNIVATADLGRPISLESASVSLQALGVEFEPEQFPGMILRLREPHAVVLVFSSGKYVVTGTHDFPTLDLAVRQVHDLLAGQD